MPHFGAGKNEANLGSVAYPQKGREGQSRIIYCRRRYGQLLNQSQDVRERRSGPVTELQKHASDLAAHPADWMPWNYRNVLQKTDVTHSRTHHNCGDSHFGMP